MSLKGIDEKVAARLEALIAHAQAIDVASERCRDIPVATTERLAESKRLEARRNGFLASAMHLLEVIFPSPLNAHRQRANTIVALTGNQAAASVAAILEAVRADVAAGIVRTVAEAARVEVFDDFLDHAEHFLRGGKVPYAGVIAGVVFEDVIRQRSGSLGIIEKGVELDQLITRLVAHAVLKPVQAKRARAAAGLRTSAAHAQWDEFSRGDVDAAIMVTREIIDGS